LPVKVTQNCQFRQRHDRKTSETEPLAERQPVDMPGFITAGGLGRLRSVFVASKAGQIRWVTRSGFGPDPKSTHVRCYVGFRRVSRLILLILSFVEFDPKEKLIGCKVIQG
jgi:hypothetical protein